MIDAVLATVQAVCILVILGGAFAFIVKSCN